jgi:GNAT superfamily N-acetyltransferase
VTNYIKENCAIFDIKTERDIEGFCCGDEDLDNFFNSDCFAYSTELLGKTYCCKETNETHRIVCAFTLANSSIRVSDLPNSRKKKIEESIPHRKALKDYPAVLIARLGVSKDFRSLHIGSEILQYIKVWFLDPNNKTGCRFILVDAYNTAGTIAFYEKNGFKTVFGSEQQECEYRQMKQDTKLNTRLMFFDLMTLSRIIRGGK